MREKPPKPTEGELELLGVLWRRGTSTVRDIHEEVTQKRSLGYTSILKLLQIMNEKGLVQRESSGKAHLYQTTLSREETQDQLLSDLKEKLFSGSAAQLAMHALSMEPADSQELEEIRALLARKAKKA